MSISQLTGFYESSLTGSVFLFRLHCLIFKVLLLPPFLRQLCYNTTVNVLCQQFFEAFFAFFENCQPFTKMLPDIGGKHR